MDTKQAITDAVKMAHTYPVETAKLNESGKLLADDLREGKVSVERVGTLFLSSLTFVTRLAELRRQ